MQTVSSDTGCRYRIVLRGECGPLVAALFADVAIESGGGCTCITASVRDDSELYGLIDRFEDLALHLITLGELSVTHAADTAAPATSLPPGDAAAAASIQSGKRLRDLHVAAAQSPGLANGIMMTEISLDELGPVDYVVVEFPPGASNFTGEMASELRSLADSGTIRVIDVLILTKDADGTVEATELSDVGDLGELLAIEAGLAELLAADDVDQLAAAMEPGSTAGVLIWENLWAAPFASAARRSGGQLIADGRIPIQAIIASIEADEATATAGD
jgi:hypothetical protein